MLTFIGVILIAANIISAQPMVDYGLKNEEIGRLPEVVITAQRFEGEDIAYSGMLPEIVVTAPRYAPSNLDVTLISILKRKLPLRLVYPELVFRADFRSTGYLN